MERALRTVSVERGVDPRGLALVAFGGAGPLHACALAEALDMAAVIVPARAGVLSAVGLLTAPVQRDLVRSWPTPGDHTGLDAALAELAAPGGRARRRRGRRRPRRSTAATRARATSSPCRPSTTSTTAHRLRNGFARPDAPVEVVALRATAVHPERARR